MSAEDKQHLDAVFQDSADLTDAVITVVGGKFLPSVDSASNFNTYKDSNLPFLDNKLKKILDGSSLRTHKFNQSFQYGDVVVSIEDTDGNGKYSLCSSVNAVSLNSYTASIEPYYEMYKMSESAGVLVKKNCNKKGYNERF